MKRDPGLYDYLPYNAPAEDRLAERRAVAFWVAPNIEFYEFEPPPQPGAHALGAAAAGRAQLLAPRLRQPRRLLAHDGGDGRCGIRGSVSLNVALCDHHPEIIEACAKRGWEFFSHGIYNTRYVFGMSEDQERAIIQDSIETIRKCTGQKLDGWLAPALSNTDRTMDLVAEDGHRLHLRPLP